MLTPPVEVRFRRLEGFDEALEPPRYETAGAAGADLRCCLPDHERAEGLELGPGARVLAPTGLAMAIPAGYEGQVRPRSGLAVRAGVTVANAPGTIDSDYRGEVKVLLVNLGDRPFRISHGDRIAQLVIAPVIQARFVAGELGETPRGTGGFGSTGVAD